MTSRNPSICDSCTRRRTAVTCDAFPDLIPIEICTLGGDHRMPVEGDHGLQWDWNSDIDACSWWEQFYQAGVNLGYTTPTPGAPDLLPGVTGRKPT